MNVQYDLVVDFARPSKSNTIIVSEDDDKSRVLHFTLLSNKQPFSMLGVINAYIVGYKPDGTPLVDTTSNLEILKDSEGNKINEINYTIPKEVTAYSGNINMQIVLQGDDGSRITSFDFYVLVRNGLYNEAEMVDEDTYNGFRDLLTESELVLEQMKSYAQEATRPNPYPLSITIEDETTNYSGSASESVTIKDVAYIADDIDIEVDNLEESSVAQCAAYAETCLDAKDYAVNAISASQNAVSAANDAEFFKTSAGNSSLVSEGFASGTQDGVPVEADSPYYQNNAKYYADLANSGAPTWKNVTGKPFSTIGSGLVVDGGEVSVPKQRILESPDYISKDKTKGWLELWTNTLTGKTYVQANEYYSDRDLMHETVEGQQIVQKPVSDCIDELYENGSTDKTEVINARVGTDGKTYANLESRLNAEIGELNDDIVDLKKDNYNVSYSGKLDEETITWIAKLPSKYVTIRDLPNFKGNNIIRFHVVPYGNTIKVVLMSVSNGLYTIEYLEDFSVKLGEWNTIDIDYKLNEAKEYCITCIQCPYTTQQYTSARGYKSITFADNNNLAVGDTSTNISSVQNNATMLFYTEIVDIKERKKWDYTVGNFLGDSLTEQGIFTGKMNSLYGIQVNNYGKSGTTISDKNGSNYFSTRISGMSTSCDFVFVLGGTNDWGLGTTLGTKTDTTLSTFYGGLYDVFSKLRNKFPTKPIFVSTILQRNWTRTTDQSSGIDSNINGNSIEEFNDAIRYMAHRYGCTVIDGYGESGIIVANLASYTLDNLHFNDNGGTRYATFVKDRMEIVTPYN